MSTEFLDLEKLRAQPLARDPFPFVVVSGMWGMNFAHLPLERTPYGFEIMVVLQLALGMGLIWVLRRRGWL